MILTLQSTTFGAYGGIPTYNRVVARVLNDFETPIEKRLLIVTDSPKDLEGRGAELSGLKLKAFASKRGSFVSHVLRLGLTRRIDLVLIGHVNYAPLGLALKLLQPELRYGVMVHGTEVWSRLSPLRRRALRKADFITSVSDYTKSQAVKVNGANAERIQLLPNTLEWNGANSENGKEMPLGLASGIKLLSVCRLDSTDPYKGIDTVIEALPELLSKIPNLHYYVVGKGNDLERHKILAARHGVTDRVHFLGSVDSATLRSHYEACDLFVLPSAGEGFGIVFLEAMRYSKAIVAARSGGIPEVVQDGVTGRLVEYGNEEQLKRALVDMCLDADERRRLGVAGYHRLQEKFTFEHFQTNLTEILNHQLPSRAFECKKNSQATAVESH